MEYTQQDEINEFLACVVVTMDNQTKDAWYSLSDFERKTIAASAYFFKEDYNQAQRSNLLRQIQWENITGG